MKLIETYNHRNEVGVLLELESGKESGIAEAKLSEIAGDLTVHIAGCNPSNINSMLQQGFIKNPEISVSQWLAKVGGVGVTVNRFVRYSCENT